LLDVGCGTGQLVSRLAREHPRLRAVGCDFSSGMLRQAAARGATQSWVRGDACRLPFRSGAFDVVVSTEAFHWFPDQAAALQEFRRVLAPRGLLLLALVNPRCALASDAARLASRVAGEPFTWPTAAAMRAQLVAAGFRVVRQQPVFRLPGMLLFPPVLSVATPARARPGTVSDRPPRPRAAPPRRATGREAS